MNLPVYYCINPHTHEFCGTREAQRDPLESERAGHDVFCGPGPSDTTEPPPMAGPNQAAVWTGTSWVLVSDHRGETWWEDHHQPVVVRTLGDPSQLGLVPIRPDVPPEQVPVDRTGERIAELEAKLDALMRAIAEAANGQTGGTP